MTLLLSENVVFFLIINTISLVIHFMLRKQYRSESYQVFIGSVFISTFLGVGLMDVLQKTIRNGTIKLSEGFGGRTYYPPMYMDRPAYTNSYGNKVVSKKKRV